MSHFLVKSLCMTQKQIVINKLKTDGFITRNYCLKIFISRLGAIIDMLKKEGWQIEGRNDNGDYLYEVKGTPFKKVEYFVPALNKKIDSYEL